MRCRLWRKPSGSCKQTILMLSSLRSVFSLHNWISHSNFQLSRIGILHTKDNRYRCWGDWAQFRYHCWQQLRWSYIVNKIENMKRIKSSPHGQNTFVDRHKIIRISYNHTKQSHECIRKIWYVSTFRGCVWSSWHHGSHVTTSSLVHL
jgi:hypothetical protein